MIENVLLFFKPPIIFLRHILKSAIGHQPQANAGHSRSE
jgi:hypothetical protein